MTGGSRIADQAIVNNSKLTFGVQVSKNAHLENCKFEGVFTIFEGKHLNETQTHYPDIKISNAPSI
jgi:hypothetical protein